MFLLLNDFSMLGRFRDTMKALLLVTRGLRIWLHGRCYVRNDEETL